MAAQGWTLTLGLIALQLLAVTAQVPAVVSIAVQPEELPVTTATEDFIIQAKRQYAANLIAYEREVAVFREKFLTRADVMEMDTTLLEAKYREVNERLLPLELLGGLSKHCVQKYWTQLTSIATVRTSLTTCVTTARNNLATIISFAETTMRTLSSYYSNNLIAALAECEKKNAGAYLNYTLCATKAIANTDAFTLSNRKTFDIQMQTAKCSAESWISSSVDCRFTTMFKAIADVGTITSKIDNCIAGNDFCPPCPPNAGSKTSGCNGMDLKWSPLTFESKTIDNPFFGLGPQVACLQVNFQRNEL